ncbi:MAG TPA: transcription termination/antitermination protein NusG [Lapillicoccus sp.]|nr:transcription termination/antitermination protein NusG [Lapillicoccus sp.]
MPTDTTTDETTTDAGANGAADVAGNGADEPGDVATADPGVEVEEAVGESDVASEGDVVEAEADEGVEAEAEAEVAEDEPGVEVVETAADEPIAEVAEDEPGVEVVETAADEPVAEVAEAAADEPVAEVAEAAADEAGADVEVVTDEQLLAEPPVIDNPFTRPGRWFVVHTQSGYEKKVKQNLEARIHSMNAEEAVYEVVIPMEDYVDFKNGKRVVAQRKMFPGYLLVRAELDDTAWFVIRNTPGVTGFVGQGAKPSPLPRRDVEAFLMPKGTEEQVANRAKPRLEYEIGETVRVREGPFADFSGEVIEINEDQLKLKVLVNIFGRETPVELEFSKVAKL